MKQSRYEYFCSLTEKEKRELTFDKFTVSEIQEIINETVLRDEDRKIAELRFINCKTIQQIADFIYIDYKTCVKRLERISILIKQTKNW